MRSRLRIVVVLFLTTVLVVLGLAAPAQAATQSERLSVATGWTQPTAGSQQAWNTARLNQVQWAGYAFDWSTDYCSSSPDQPMGFDFRLSCHRHDFGYRNFKRLGVFAAHKTRLDNSFYYDLRQACARYPVVARQACLGLAWTYYQAVKKFGALVVSKAQVDRIAASSA